MKTREKKFPCECGKSFDTAEQFTDHCHTDCKNGTVAWQPSEDYLAERKARQ